MTNLVLIATVGTLGDVLPAIALGRLMAGRGHAVVILADVAFADLIRLAGLDADTFGQPGTLSAITADPEYWHADKGFPLFAKRVVRPAITPMIDAIRRRAWPGRTVIAAFQYAFGAMLAAHQRRLPLVHLSIQPAALDASGAFRRRLSAIESYVSSVGAAWSAPIEADEAPIVGLFPDWFCPSTARLTKGAVLTGFPIVDCAVDQPMPDVAGRFLDAGPAPIVFLARGDPTRVAEIEALLAEICGAAGRRLFVLDNTAEPFADGTLCRLPFAPLPRLLLGAAVLVHHGGIGTIAQALAAGIPQLALTSNFETPENAAAMVGLGTGLAMPVTEVDRTGLAQALKDVTTSPEIRERCASWAERMRRDNPFARTAEIVERVLTPSA